MSLRTRLIASIVLVLLVSLGLACVSAGWSAARSVRTELLAALTVAEQTTRHAFEDLATSDDPRIDLSRLVKTFDGDRHVRAVLLDATGQPLVSSTLFRPAAALPGWFVRLVAPALPPRLLAVPTPPGSHSPVLPGSNAVMLTAEPLNELGEVWAQLRNSLAVLTVFCALSTLLVSLLVGRALRPLKQVSAAFAAVGVGEYAIRLPQANTREVAGLVHGFNTMAARLGVAEAQNRRLHEQLVTLQEEERADLARDLHDEVGPFLFTVALDAAEIERVAMAMPHTDLPAIPTIPAIRERAAAIREAVGHMQRHVRAMLKRLRLASPVEVGLRTALDNLVAFWQGHRPLVAFSLTITIDEDGLTEPTKAVVYRVAQEGLSNAIRHGRPDRIDIVVTAAVDGQVTVSISDDGVGMTGDGVGAGHADDDVSAGHADDGASEPGFGLSGMRERVTALGGSLDVRSPAGGSGLTLTARLPGGMTEPPRPLEAATS